MNDLDVMPVAPQVDTVAIAGVGDIEMVPKVDYDTLRDLCQRNIDARKAAEERADYNGQEWARSAEALVLTVKRAESAEARAREMFERTKERCAVECELEKVEAEETKHPSDFAYNNAIKHAATAIRALQPETTDSTEKGDGNGR